MYLFFWNRFCEIYLYQSHKYWCCPFWLSKPFIFGSTIMIFMLGLGQHRAILNHTPKDEVWVLILAIFRCIILAKSLKIILSPTNLQVIRVLNKIQHVKIPCQLWPKNPKQLCVLIVLDSYSGKQVCHISVKVTYKDLSFSAWFLQNPAHTW